MLQHPKIAVISRILKIMVNPENHDVNLRP